MENYKTLMKEIKEDLNKWRYIPCSQIDRPNIIKKSILYNLFYKSLQPNENPRKVFFISQQNDSQVYMEKHKIKNSHHNTEEKEHSWSTNNI